MLERVREWNDLFPWLRLIRALRMAGSPTLVLLSFMVLGVWWLGTRQIVGELAEVPQPRAEASPLDAVGLQSLEWFSGLAAQTSPSSLYRLPGESADWRLLLATVWSMLIWTPVALFMIRQGALLTAGRPMMGLRTGFGLAFSRLLRAWLCALVPTVCVAMITLMVVGIGKLGQWVEGIAVIEIGFAILLGLIALVCGLLAFGSHFAIPLGWAALAIEQHPDPLDSLSRGYEYLLRRPLHLCAYVIVSLTMILVIACLASGVASAAISVADAALAANDDVPSVEERVVSLLGWFPLAVVVTLAWGLLGGVYLLLRCDAGGQEVEDLWIPLAPPAKRLPTLP